MRRGNLRVSSRQCNTTRPAEEDLVGAFVVSFQELPTNLQREVLHFVVCVPPLLGAHVRCFHFLLLPLLTSQKAFRFFFFFFFFFQKKKKCRSAEGLIRAV